jgi:1,4-alpha-glucan branching enzyme
MSWHLERGANLADDGTVTFSIWAPRADAMSVRLLGPGGAPRAELPMARDANAVFTARASAGDAPAGSDYLYVLPGLGGWASPVFRR